MKLNTLKVVAVSVFAACLVIGSLLSEPAQAQSVPTVGPSNWRAAVVKPFPNLNRNSHTATATHTNCLITIEPDKDLSIFLSLTNCPGASNTETLIFATSPDGTLWTTNATQAGNLTRAITFVAADSGKPLVTNFVISASSLTGCSFIKLHSSVASGGTAVYLDKMLAAQNKTETQ